MPLYAKTMIFFLLSNRILFLNFKMADEKKYKEFVKAQQTNYVSLTRENGPKLNSESFVRDI